jgi:Tol biopolymer transport system component
LNPSWSPDGSRIVFESSSSGNSEIYLIGADGTGQTNLTNRPAAHDTEPDWSRGSRGTAAVRMTRSVRDLWDQLNR